jgi:DNA mismatch repair protein MSH2
MVDFGDDVKLERNTLRGYTFRTKKANEKAVRNVPTVELCQVLKDGIYFTTGSLRRAASTLLEKGAEYEDEQRSVVTEAISVARSYLPVLEACSGKIGELDAFASMAFAAVSGPAAYVRPTLTGVPGGPARKIRIIRGRHPILELQDDVSFIANDYIMDGGDAEGAGSGAGAAAASSSSSSSSMDEEGSSSSSAASGLFHIITGPNMGGKSTYIRTLGVLCLLAQMGSFVPAEEAELPVLDCICARVGAGDRALKGVSTFMAEMLEASAILSTATDRSLVIIDELGRGTSTYDGFGLAWAISEHLTKQTRCFTLFATHYHELTALSDELPGIVRNRHVSAHVRDSAITMLYAVEEGPCPSSFGIHVAELAAFPQSVIDEARKKATQLEATSGIILAKHRQRARLAAARAAGAAAAASSSSSSATFTVEMQPYRPGDAVTPAPRSVSSSSSSSAAAGGLDADGDGAMGVKRRAAAAGVGGEEEDEGGAADAHSLALSKGKRLLALADDPSFPSLPAAEKRRKLAELLA